MLGSDSARALLVGVLVLLAPVVSAEIYRWVDEDGKVHFSDEKPTDNKAETLDLEVPEVREPDEGELRRRELLKNAEEDFAYKQRRAAEDARRDNRSRIDAPTHYGADKLCEQARIRYGVLQEPMPIYWTNDNELRPAWSNDTYKGERTYVADDERPELIRAVRENMSRSCAEPDDMDAQYWTYRDWEHEQWCAAFKAKVAAARLPRSRTPRNTLKKLEEEYARDC